MSHQSRIALSAAAAIALLAVQFAAIRLAPSETLVRIALPATLAGVPFALWAHRRYLGVWVIFVGVFANLAAILANGGLMPIERSTVIEAVGPERAAGHVAGRWIAGSKDVLVEDGDGRLVALGDGIVVRLGGRGMAASPGDIVIWSGLLILVAESSLAWHRTKTSVLARDRAEARGGAITLP
jgi:hypothetical protein